MVNKALFSSNKQDWCTPKNIVDLIHGFKPIQLDPCSNSSSIVNAKEIYSLEDYQDGLILPWKSLSFINCPYDKSIAMWLSKAEFEYNTNAVESITLIPARTDTKWFHNYCNTICFIKGRLKFLGAKSSAPFPSMLVYFGNDVAYFHNYFQYIGKVH